MTRRLAARRRSPCWSRRSARAPRRRRADAGAEAAGGHLADADAGGRRAGGRPASPAAADREGRSPSARRSSTRPCATRCRTSGFTLYVADPGPAPGHTRDEDIIERAGGGGHGRRASRRRDVGAQPARRERGGGDVPRAHRRRAARAGASFACASRRCRPTSVGVRGLVMLRDLLSPRGRRRGRAASRRSGRPARGTTQGVIRPATVAGPRRARGQRRALRRVHGALSLQTRERHERSARALSAARARHRHRHRRALLVADEWDVTTGDAWFLSAGGWLGRDVRVPHRGRPATCSRSTDRYSWGVGGGLIGLGLATLALTRTTMDDGDATLPHSGAALGLLLGGDDATGSLAARRRRRRTPAWATARPSACVGAGTLATQVTLSPSRVLLIDLGAGGGALVGAAAASPLIFQQGSFSRTPARARQDPRLAVGDARRDHRRRRARVVAHAQRRQARVVGSELARDAFGGRHRDERHEARRGSDLRRRLVRRPVSGL